MGVFEKSDWIWCNDDAGADEYGEFVNTFRCDSETVRIRISCDGDYALWINGAFVESNQYGDFEHYKIYDTIDISPYTTSGTNRIALLVWHFGADSQRYRRAPAGLIYEVFTEDEILAASETDTLCRLSRAYRNGRRKKITGQLGFGFSYDATKEDLWIYRDAEGFYPATEVEKHCVFYPRPIEKLKLLSPVPAKEIRRENGRILLDLGRETVGLLTLSLHSFGSQRLTVAFGEHLQDDGWVPRIIDGRDFSVEYAAKDGKNEYFNPMLRFGCRYLEIQGEKPVEIDFFGLIPQIYPTEKNPVNFADPLDQKIYEICANTLDLCMMEHYVDCPWREQNLYAFDSRNQMICGYTVYKGGNFAYARANLKLMAQDTRSDGLLSICAPCGADLTIPSFSLYYFLAVKEYTEHSGDPSLFREVFGKICDVMNVFLARKQGRLIRKFEGKEHWNFYDWSQYSEGTLGKSEEGTTDGMINCLTVFALDNLEKACELTGLTFPYPGVADEIRKETKRVFFDRIKGLMTMEGGTEKYTDILNSMAILAGVITHDEAKSVCEKMILGQTVPCSLSMRALKYDALLTTDRERYEPHILAEIRRDYGKMLSAGSDTVWETVKGAEDFHGAGSLCHGWSAVPVLYLKKTNL